jgi:NitT/TauT family transport system substrate-binding protein
MTAIDADYELELALDWTPNTNHLGVYVALAEGYYEDAGVDLTVRSPAEDDYETTPAKRVATGASDLAIAPSESAISYHTHPAYPSLTAVAAVCHRDESAIVALAASDVERPRDLDGRTYASYDARFEDDIVRQLVRNDGGDGDVEIITPPKLGIPNTLVDGDADATWVFLPWEGLQAERDGIDLRAFRLDEYDVPYGYTPVVLAHPAAIGRDASAWTPTAGTPDTTTSSDGDAERGDPAAPEAVAAFLEATRRGYELAAAEPARAADRLAAVAGDTAPGLDDPEFLRESARRLAGSFVDPDPAVDGWGEMRRERWATFVDWLAAESILETLEGDHIPADEIDVDALFTNDLLRSTPVE